jgi:HK97 family phage major capsid protein
MKALSITSDPDGGYLVSPAMSDQMTTIIFETSPIRQLASVQTISTDSLDVLDDKDQAAGNWTGETQPRADTNTPQLGKRNIPVHELSARPKITQKLIDDAAVDVEAWLSQKVADIFARKQNTAFVSGSGSNQPRGFLTYAAGTSWGQIEQVNSGTAGEVTPSGLIALYYSLKSEYARNATFLMNRSVVQKVRELKDGTGQYLWQPGLQAGQPDLLLGAPVMMASDMPAAGAGTLSVALGDFRRGYQIVDRAGIRTLRDPFTEKPFVLFYSTVRTGGDVLNFEAIKLLKLSS